MDDSLRIQTDTETTEGGLQPLEGIKRIRERLRRKGTVVRLVGLAGVGKTRLVQALFDDRLGDGGLDPSLAHYTDIADDPDPLPTKLASDLIAARKRAILIIDNCPPDLHRRLSDTCRCQDSLLSLITVEYDVREDQPEGTEVFSLEPSSVNLIEKLVRRRFPEISPVDAQTVANFSGGNARIAISLAETIDKNETITGLSDDDLIRRLIEQRHGPNDSIMLAAQALSLVYSFQGDDISREDQAELFRLGALIGKTAQEMFRLVAELRERDLIQRRGVWRAVLPHAIANRLAATALKKIPLPEIESSLFTGPERLLISFSRRLGYLDASKEAKAIVRGWLGQGGLLEKVVGLNDLGTAMLNNIAPAAPEEVLAALERLLLHHSSPDTAQKCQRYVPLLRSISYDAASFERCITLILKIADAVDLDGDGQEVQRVVVSLFWIHLSGTHATIEQRLLVIRSLLQSEDFKRRKLGIRALEAVMQTSHFSATHGFEFGARSRDYGFWPRTKDEQKDWFRSGLQLAEAFGCSDEPLASEVRTAVAEQFRGLWSRAAMHACLERICRTFSANEFWAEGWVAVRQAIHYDSGGMSAEISARLASIEELLRPRDLVQKVRSILLCDGLVDVGFDSQDDSASGIQARLDRTRAAARDLGKFVAADEEAFAKLLPELVSKNAHLMWTFGQGLAEGAEEPASIWERLVTQLASTTEDKQKIVTLCGFLDVLQVAGRQLVDNLLDNALEDETLARWYPLLQTAVDIGKQDVKRLMLSLALGKAPIRTYGSLSGGRTTDPISGPDFRDLLLEISAKPEGLDVATEIIYMRFLSYESRKQDCDAETLETGRKLIRQLNFTKRNSRQDYRLGVIAKYSLAGAEGASIVKEICMNLRAAAAKYETSMFYHNDLLEGLFSVQPIGALDGLCQDDTTDLDLSIRILDDVGQLRNNPFNVISETDLLAWCEGQPKTRYPIIATAITVFKPTGEDGQLQLSGIARQLVAKAPDVIQVLKAFISQLEPIGWGSQPESVESNARLLDEFANHPDFAVRDFIANAKLRLADAIKAQGDIEVELERQRDQRFE